MSGFEVIGVVLATVPLLIMALEDYRGLNRKRDVFLKRSLHIGRMVNALKEQQILIEGDIEILLHNSGFDCNELDQIKAGGNLGLLTENDIAEEVKALLGAKRYDTYITTLSVCEKTLFQIAKEIGRLKQGVWIDNGRLEDMLKINSMQDAGHEYIKRWKFTMAKDDLEAAIGELDHSTNMLRRLRVLGCSVNQQVLESSSRRSTKAIRFLQNVRNRAMSLYNAIASTWTRQCHDDHLARLTLEHRLSVCDAGIKGRFPRKQTVINFDVIFEASAGTGKPFHHSSTIEVLESDYENSAIKTKISFQLPSNELSLIDLGDICQAVSDANTAHRASKLYLLCNQRLQCPEKVPTATTTTTGHQSYVSLADIMKSSTTRLNLSDRVLLAATIASSMMQLYSTPWLPDLRKETIMFQSKPVAGQGYCIERPIVHCSFTNSASGHQVSSRKALHRLLDLGILIVELWRNQTIESFCAANTIQLQDTYDSRQSAARRWLNEEEGEFVPLVFEAAVRCVECRFHCINMDLNDETVQRLVFEGVIKPLWENCRI